jgi:hypothetical protein
VYSSLSTSGGGAGTQAKKGHVVDTRKRSVALGVLVSLGAVALALPPAGATPLAKSPLGIKVVGTGQSDITGTFDLIGASAASSDSGKVKFVYPFGRVEKTAQGLLFSRLRWKSTLRGKRGVLVIRTDVRQYPIVKDDEEAFLGTWTVVSGTGAYARLKGGGDVAGVQETGTGQVLGVQVSFQYQGTVAKA